MHFFTGLASETVCPIRQLELIQIAAVGILRNTRKREDISSSHNHITSSNSRILAVLFSSVHTGFDGTAYSQGSGPKTHRVVQASTSLSDLQGPVRRWCPKLKPEHCETTFSQYAGIC